MILALTEQRMRQQHPNVSLESGENARNKQGLSTDPLSEGPDAVNGPHGKSQSSCPRTIGNSDRASRTMPVYGSERSHPHHRSTLVSPVHQRVRCSRSRTPAVFAETGIHPLTGPTDFLTLGSGVSVGGCPRGAGLTARASTYSRGDARALEICSNGCQPITFLPGGLG